MYLNFHVEVEVPDHFGEKSVAYIKHLIGALIKYAGVIRAVEYVKSYPDTYFETIEKDAVERGELFI